MLSRTLSTTLVLSLSLISTATAGTPMPDHLWFTMQSASHPSITATHGPGQTLEIIKPTSAAAVIRIGVNFTAPGGTVSGYHIALNANGGATFTNGQALGTGYDQMLNENVNGTSTGIFGRGSLNSIGSAGLVYEFDLVIPANAAPISVTGDFGNGGMFLSNSDFWLGHVGANDLAFGWPNYMNNFQGTGLGPDHTMGWGLLPVITVAVPEPASLGLLGLGLALLIRRKR